MVKNNNNEKEKCIESALLKDPRFSSSWINTAKKIISEYNWDTNELAKYNSEQIEVIYDSLAVVENKKDLNNEMDILYDPKLNATQMRLLLTAISKGLKKDDLKIYADPNLAYAKSNYLLQALIDGIDMSKYIDYDNEQIYEIYAGIVNNVDITKYDDINISAKKMGIIRHALEIKLDVVYDKNTKNITIS